MRCGSGTASRPGVQVIRLHGRSERQAGLERADGVDLPPARNPLHRLRGRAHPLPSFAEWHFKRAADSELLTHVESRARPLDREIARILDRAVAGFAAGIVDTVGPGPRSGDPDSA